MKVTAACTFTYNLRRRSACDLDVLRPDVAPCEPAPRGRRRPPPAKLVDFLLLHPNRAAGLSDILRGAGCTDPASLLFKTLVLTTSDQYWIRPAGLAVSWAEINYFDNPYVDGHAVWTVADAERLGIADGDWCWIETEWGKIREVADLYYGIAPGVVNLEHQWWYPELKQADKGFELSGCNCLIDKDAQDPFIGSSNAVKVYKATADNSPFGNPVPCGIDGTEIIHSADDPRLQEWLPDYEGRA